MTTTLTQPAESLQISVLDQERVYSADFDWAGRGTSHVDFKEDEALPLSQGRFLGHGMNGGVYETTCRGLTLAWKRRYCRKQIGTDDRREIEILKKINHRHIIKLVGTYTHGSFLGLLLWPVAVCDLGTFLEEVDSLMSENSTTNDRGDIDYQKIAHRLSQLGLSPSNGLPHTRRAVVTRLKMSIGCISDAVAYLHENGIRHKDIKPSNILLSADGLWVTDFGTATDFSLFSQSNTQNGERGTPKYFAPEVAEFKPNGRSADIFSLGCVFLEMIGLCNRYSLSFMKSLRPRKDLSFQANLGTVLEWFNFSGTAVETQRDRQLLALVREMISVDPKKRPSASHIGKRLTLIGALKSSQSTPFWGECCKPMRPSSSASAGLGPPNGGKLLPATIAIGNRHKEHGSRHHWNFFIKSLPLEGLIDVIHVFLVCLSPSSISQF